MSLVFGEVEMGNTERCKPEPGRQRVEFVSQRMQIGGRHAASISATVY